MNKYLLTIVAITLMGLSQLCFSQSIKVTRSMPSSAAPGGEFTVELSVDKGATSGFAKLQEEIPEGFVATAIESKSATFSFDKNKVKLIWMSLPADAKFTVSYKVKVDATAAGPKSISGTFSYIDGNDTKKIQIAFSSIDISSAGNASGNSSSSASSTTAPSKTIETPTPEKKEPEIVAPPVVEKAQPEKVTPPIVEKSPEPTPAPPAPAPEPKKVAPAKPKVTPAPAKEVAGITYRVQVGAGQSAGSEGYLKSKYNIAEEISSEQVDGLYKYTAGSFSSFAAAKELRDKIRSAGLEGAFIVAYQNGARMNLQEALKISGQ